MKRYRNLILQVEQFILLVFEVLCLNQIPAFVEILSFLGKAEQVKRENSNKIGLT